jgi:outer membrane immunogenic protein
MKNLMLTLIAAVLMYSANGQYALSKGSSQLNAGIGLSTWGIPVYIGFDYGAGTDISAGAEVSFRNYSTRFAGERYRHSIMGFSGNVNYHFNGILDIPEEFDVYAGLNLGFYVWNSRDNYPGSDLSGVGIGAQIGGRYYFDSKTAVNLEFGGGNSFGGGKFGITRMF